MRPCSFRDKKSSEVIVLPQPVCLGWQVPVQDIAFLVLEAPRDNDQDVALADPCTLLDLSLDTAHPLYAVVAPDTDMVCTHHQFGHGELFVQFLFREPDADNRCPVGIEFGCTSRIIGFFSMIININISGVLNQ